MAEPPSSVNKLLVLLLIFTTLFDAAFAKSPRSVAKLIHRESVHSPYYNPDATSYDHANLALKSSLARFAYLQKRTETISTTDYRAPVFTDNSVLVFIANISIGEPPVVQLVSMDTGSDLLWVQCFPCSECIQQSCPIFDPSKSSTYANLSCYSHQCPVSSNGICDEVNNCEYNQGYFDGTTSIGTLATEKLTLETSDEGISTVSDVVFGCGHQNNDNDGKVFSGILGLGNDDISLVARLGSKFSYCIGNISDTRYAYNNLILGEGAKMEGNWSPLELLNSLYYLELEGISVGEKRLAIDPNTFKMTPTGSGGVLIDSGASYSFLARGAYEPFSNEVQNLLYGVLKRVPYPGSPAPLCYKGNISRDLKGFPVVTFHFAGGVELGLDTGSMFQDHGPDLFCMAVLEAPFNKDLSLIGVMAQQFYNVAYDVVGNTISFLRLCLVGGERQR